MWGASNLDNLPIKTQAAFHKALLPTYSDNDFIDTIRLRLTVAFVRCPFPTDAGACAVGLFHTIRVVNRRLLPQMAVPIVKLAFNAWHLGPASEDAGRTCPFCGGPLTGSLTHLLACPGLFTTVTEVLPGCPWSEAPTVRLLQLCGVGADDSRRAIVGTTIDGIWATMVANRRGARPARVFFRARLAAMARLSPLVADLLDRAGFVHHPVEDPV